MLRRQRGESLSERLRSEVQQVSAALWQIGPSIDENAASGDTKTVGNSQRSSADVNVGSTADGFPCPRQVKPLLFFYKYLQPIGGAAGVGGSNENSGNAPTSNSSLRKLRVNLPLTVVCERTNAQELVLWLHTDAQGNVVREEKTLLWRKKLHNDLVGVTASPPSSHDSDPVLAVRSVARWKNSIRSTGGSAVVLTRRTLDPVLAVPCELPICIQQFVHCRGSQASVYRIFWCEQERKCFAVNLTSSLKNTEAPEDVATTDRSSVSTPTATSSGLSASTTATMNATFEAAMVTAAQTAGFYCVTVSPDARACARWPKLRGAAIAEGVQATSRVVEHVQMQLPTLRFHLMTADFIKDTSGVWWLTRVVDFKASSSVEPSRDDGSFGSRDSAVLIPEALRTKQGRSSNELQMDEVDSPPRESTLLRGDELNNTPNARFCFLCGCSCELTPTFRGQLEAMIKGQRGDEYKESSTISMEAPAVDEFRMTLTMALDTIFLMRQRGVGLPTWENAVSTVRKSQLRDVCDFPVCMLCYRIYQQQNRLQLIARELHNALSPTPPSSSDRPEGDTDAMNGSTTDITGVGMATSAASGLAGSQLLSTELRFRLVTPRNVLDALEAFQAETIPPSLVLRGDAPELRPTWSILKPVRGADVDPTSTQLRLVFFFHELQDGGPDLVPTDFFLEYQLGQNVTRVQLEGSKMHTPNRWQLCEARVHYLCATLTAFSEFCSHKRLLIKLKAKPRPMNENVDNGMEGHEHSENAQIDEDDRQNGFIRSGSPSGARNRSRDKEEFVGYTLLSLRSVNTAAKWFGNSLQPESRTDYLLELHTASYGLLTLKLTVGLLVDPVPLGHVRDVLRDRIFLEEQTPRGVYWPPLSHCLSGLAVPRDWVGALMPSEYTKILPMRRRNARGVHPVTALYPSRTQTKIYTTAATTLTPHRGTQSLPRQNSADLMEATTTFLSASGTPRRASIKPNVTKTKNWSETARELASTGAINGDLAAGLEVDNTDPVQSEYGARPQHLMTVTMGGTTLLRACLAAKRIISRVAEDGATNNFPTVLLAAILRYASFENPVSTSCLPSMSWSNWKCPATFQFTRRYSVDRLLAEVKPGGLPMLALLGELLLVLIEDKALPARVDAGALESLLEPFWQQDSGWSPIPRTQSSCLPERRVVWNRAIRRWEAATGDAMVDETPQLDTQPDLNVNQIVETHSVTLTTDIGDFRAKSLALVLCELFEQMESLDNGYIEIAELRSLAKCLPEQEYLGIEEQLDPDVGTRERLTQQDVAVLAELVEQQRRLALRTILHSLMGSTVMMDALARFDRVGSGEMRLEQFRELASEALFSQRKVFRVFQEEPKKSQDGFCLRHGFTEIYATDSVCVLCAAEYQTAKPAEPPEQSPERPQSAIADNTETTTVGTFQAEHDTTRRSSTLSRRRAEVDFYQEENYNEDARRASSPLPGKNVLEDSTKETGLRRRHAVAARPETTRQVVDVELDNMLDRLHAAERTIVIGEAQVSERKGSATSLRAWQSCVSASSEDVAGRHTSSSSDLGSLARNTERKSSTGPVSAQLASQADASAALDKETKKKIKKRILKKTARRLKSTNQLPTSASLSKLLRMEFADRKRTLETSASETIIDKAVRVEERRKQLDRLVLAEVQEVKRRLAKLLDES